MPRPPLPPERRKPRTSGDPRAPTETESAHQRAVLANLAADVGAELCRRRVTGHRRGKTGGHPATWAALARVLGIGPATLSRANAAPAKARFVRPATLLRWERAARAWIAGEATPPLADEP